MKLLALIGFIIFVYLQQQLRAETPRKKEEEKEDKKNPLLESEIEKNEDFQSLYPESSKHIERLKKQEKPPLK